MCLLEHLKCTWGSHYVSIGQHCAGGSQCHRLVVWGRLLVSGCTLPHPLSVTRSSQSQAEWFQKESLVESEGGLGDSEAESRLGRLAESREKGGLSWAQTVGCQVETCLRQVSWICGSCGW